MPEPIYELTLGDFADMFGTIAADIPEDCQSLIKKHDFRYRKLDDYGRKQIILQVLKKIDSKELSVSGKEQEARWEKGWAENRQNFIEKGYDIAELVPKFIRPNQPIRLFHDYCLPLDSNFELNWYNVFRRWLFKKYLKDSAVVYEFGCGTGFNLVELAELYPEKKLHGLDWVAPSKDILTLLAEKFGYNITGHIFDMFNPDEQLDIAPNSAILAIGALEQLGTNFEPFLQFILSRSPAIFAHVDSILELYNEDDLLDYLAIKFDKKRNYLDGYLSRLRQLGSTGEIEILKIQRSHFGSLYHDGYSYIIWRPKSRG